MNATRIALISLILPVLGLVTGCRTVDERDAAIWHIYNLTAEQEVRLDPPASLPRFDASGLLITRAGELVTVGQQGPALYRAVFQTGGQSARLVPFTNCFAPARVNAWMGDARLDCEGVARDDENRFYVCEEVNRWILRCSSPESEPENLQIDWRPAWDQFSFDPNASFEGVAAGNNRLYVANERDPPLLIEVDLQTLKVMKHFVLRPRTKSMFGILHYSDLSWHDGKLYVLCRHHRVILEVDPKAEVVLAEFSYRTLEDQLQYKKRQPTGIMEGLAVDDHYFWLVTDNNGLGRKEFPNDTRPTLLKCRRPDRR